MNTERCGRIVEKMKRQGMDQMIISDPTAIFYLLGKWIYPGERLHALYLDSDGQTRFVLNRLFPQEEDLGVPITYYDDVEDGVEILHFMINHVICA